MPSAMPSFPTINGPSIEGTKLDICCFFAFLTLHEVVKGGNYFEIRFWYLNINNFLPLPLYTRLIFSSDVAQAFIVENSFDEFGVRLDFYKFYYIFSSKSRPVQYSYS